MKYVKEVVDLLAAYPERPFKMGQLLNYISPGSGRRARASLRVSAWRALNALEETGVVEIIRSNVNGGSTSYRWKSITSDAGATSQKTSQ